MRQNKILITGANSFLGKRLIARLSKGNHQLLLTSLHAENQSNIIEMNLTNVNNIKSIISKYKPDIIFHLAALVDLSRDYQIAKKCIDINIIGTLNLLETIKQVSVKKVVFASTEEIYGDQIIPFQENQVPNPPSPYSMTKMAGEYLCHQYANQLNFDLLIFRIATFYGPQNTQNRLIPQTIIKALKNETIYLNSGTKKRDYIFVDDVIDAFQKSLIITKKNRQQFIETINLGGSVSYSLKNIVDLIISITKSKSKIIYGYYPDRVGEADYWLMDITKAKSILNWQPKTTLEQGLIKTVSFFKSTHN